MAEHVLSICEALGLIPSTNHHSHTDTKYVLENCDCTSEEEIDQFSFYVAVRAVLKGHYYRGMLLSYGDFCVVLGRGFLRIIYLCIYSCHSNLRQADLAIISLFLFPFFMFLLWYIILWYIILGSFWHSHTSMEYNLLHLSPQYFASLKAIRDREMLMITGKEIFKRHHSVNHGETV